MLIEEDNSNKNSTKNVLNKAFYGTCNDAISALGLEEKDLNIAHGQ